MRRSTLSEMTRQIEGRMKTVAANGIVVPKNNGTNRTPRKRAILSDMNERAKSEGRTPKFASNY